MTQTQTHTNQRCQTHPLSSTKRKLIIFLFSLFSLLFSILNYYVFPSSCSAALMSLYWSNENFSFSLGFIVGVIFSYALAVAVLSACTTIVFRILPPYTFIVVFVSPVSCGSFAKRPTDYHIPFRPTTTIK